jgi:hypothetical protein
MESDKKFKEERNKIVKGLEIAYTRLLDYKRKINSPMVISRGGEVIEISPDDLTFTTFNK